MRDFPELAEGLIKMFVHKRGMKTFITSLLSYILLYKHVVDECDNCLFYNLV